MSLSPQVIFFPNRINHFSPILVHRMFFTSFSPPLKSMSNIKVQFIINSTIQRYKYLLARPQASLLLYNLHVKNAKYPKCPETLFITNFQFTKSPLQALSITYTPPYRKHQHSIKFYYMYSVPWTNAYLHLLL